MSSFDLSIVILEKDLCQDFDIESFISQYLPPSDYSVELVVAREECATSYSVEKNGVVSRCIPFEESLSINAIRNKCKASARGKYITFVGKNTSWYIADLKTILDSIKEKSKRNNVFLIKASDLKRVNLKVFKILKHTEAAFIDFDNAIFKTKDAKAIEFDTKMILPDNIKFATANLQSWNRYVRISIPKPTLPKKWIADCETEVCEEDYLHDLKLLFSPIINHDKEKHGFVLPYSQNLIAKIVVDDLIRFTNHKFEDGYIKEYKSYAREVLNDVEDFIIWRQNGYRDYRLYALSLKHGYDITRDFVYAYNGIYYKNLLIYNNYEIDVTNVDIKGHSIRIEGQFKLIIPEDEYKIKAVVNGNAYYAKTHYQDESKKVYILGDLAHEIKSFEVECTLLEDINDISIELEYHAASIKLQPKYSFIARLSNDVQNSYRRIGKYLVSINEKVLRVSRNSRERRMSHEKRLVREIISKKRWGVLFYRVASLLCSKVIRRPIWVFVDYWKSAGDNAESLYTFISNNGYYDQPARMYFALSKESNDYKRVKQIGRVIDPDSIRFKILFTIASLLITSQTFYNAESVFGKDAKYIRDLYRFKYAYLQHGVIKDNHADTQSKHRKDIKLFVTSSQSEADSIIYGIGGNYFYDETIVKTTGLARHDGIVGLDLKEKRNCITVAPTWRVQGVGEYNHITQTYEESATFKDTDFYRFYESLITDPRILSALEKYDYYINLRLHKRTMQQASDFTTSDRVVIEREKTDYLEDIRKTSLLVTDYSSIAFDYAYAYIPVIYAQYDIESFYNNHLYYRGYFDYEEDGFGQVVYTYEDTVATIISAMENDCQMSELYRNRVDEFFAYRDGNNCARIYNELLKM